MFLYKYSLVSKQNRFLNNFISNKNEKLKKQFHISQITCMNMILENFIIPIHDKKHEPISKNRETNENGLISLKNLFQQA